MSDSRGDRISIGTAFECSSVIGGTNFDKWTDIWHLKSLDIDETGFQKFGNRKAGSVIEKVFGNRNSWAIEIVR